MASIATDVKWGSSPTNLFNFSYSKQRSGTTQQYKITVDCEPLTGSSYFGYPIYLEITVNGSVAATKTLKSASPSQWSSALTYTTGWINVANKTTGTTPIKIRIYSGSGSSRNTTYSYNLAIDPAASLIAATDANIESVSSVIFTRYNSAFTHSLAYKAAGQSGYTEIFSKQNVTTYPWTVPKALYSLIPNDKEIEVTLRCQTYSGNTLMGTEYCTMAATATWDRCVPTVNVTAADTNTNTIALTGSNKKIIKYHSDVTVSATVDVKNSADDSKTTVILACGSNTHSGTSKTFTDAESATVGATVTDSRGFVRTASVAGLTLVNYIKLTANTTAKRAGPTYDEVTVITKGNFFNGNFGAVNNTLTVQIAYKLKGAASFSSYASMNVTISGNTYTATATLPDLDYKQAYEISVRASDAIYKDKGALADAVYNNIPLKKGVPVFDWGEEDFNFNVPITRSKDNTTIKLCYEPGDTETQEVNTAYAGIITGSTKNLLFFIPLSKPVLATTATLEGLIIGRGIGGYINGTDGTNSQTSLSGSDNYSVTTLVQANGIRVLIAFDSAIANATNNTPVVVVPYGKMTITFS